VIADESLSAAAVIRAFASERRIAPVIQTPAEYATARTTDAAFINEVNKGLVLFAREVDEQRL
jgi:hypothetical protein